MRPKWPALWLLGAIACGKDVASNPAEPIRAASAADSGAGAGAAARAGSPAREGPASAGTDSPSGAADVATAAPAAVGGSGGQATRAGTGGSGSDPDAIPATFKTVKLVLGGGGGIMPCAAAPCH